MNEVIMPTVKGMNAEGNRYRGFLYAGVMVAQDGTPKVLEYNCRFGDPETQPIMMRLRSDLVSMCLAAINGELASVEADWDPRASLGVVLAAGGYPASYNKGDVISGHDVALPAHQKVFHAGTSSKDGNVVTNGGRVLCAVSLGETVAEAQAGAYDVVKQVTWDKVYFRTDIGHRAVSREQAK
jgi:phosphoribosylamine--glycine ligase